MGLTIANVATPNATTTEGSFLGMKARVIDVTFDSAYLATGELLTADALGWDQVFGAIVLSDATVADGSTSLGVIARPNATKTQLAIQLYESLTANPHAEIGADNVSTYTTRLLVLGY